MSGEIASAFVRIRPDLRGFQGETQLGVKQAFSGVGKLFAAGFAVAGISASVKGVVDAAVQEQASLESIQQTIKRTNSDWVVHGKTVTEILKKNAAATGFSVDEQAAAFNRIQLGTKNTEKSLRTLNDAENLSRAAHINLTAASVQILKAEQGRTAGLARYGILLPKITAAEDAVKAKHAQQVAAIAGIEKQYHSAVAAGEKFTAADRERIRIAEQGIIGDKKAYAASLAVAKAQDLRASSSGVLARIEALVGGQSAKFATTAAGSVARLRVQFHEFEVSLGTRLLPVLAHSAEGLGAFFAKLSQNQELGHAVAEGGREIASAIGEGARVLEAAAGPAAQVARAVGSIVGAVGGLGTVIAFFAAFKAGQVVLGLADTSIARWERAVAAAQGPTATLNAELAVQPEEFSGIAATGTAASEALAVYTGAASAAAAASSTLASTAATVSSELGGVGSEGAAAVQGLATLAGSTRTVRAGAAAAATGARELERGVEGVETASVRASGKLSTLGRVGINLIGGWRTIALVGAAALATGLYKLVTQTSAEERAARSATEAFREFDDALSQTTQLTDSAARSRLDIALARDAKAAADAQLAQARAREVHTRGLASHAAALLDVRTAEDQDKSAALAITEAIHRHAEAVRIDTLNTRNLVKARKDARDAEFDLLKKSHFDESGLVGLENRLGRFAHLPIGAPKLPTRDLAEQAQAFARDQQKILAGSQFKTPELERQVGILRNLALVTARIPTRKQITFVLNTKPVDGELAALQGKFGGFAQLVALRAIQAGVRFHGSFTEIAKQLQQVPVAEAGAVMQALAQVPPSAEAILQIIKQFVRNAAAELSRITIMGLADAAALGAAAGAGIARTAEKDAAAIKKREDAAKLTRDALAEARQGFSDAAEQLARDQRDLADAQTNAAYEIAQSQRSLAETIKQGEKDVTDAVVSAKQNLATIGGSLADTITGALDARFKKSGSEPLTGPLARQFRELKKRIAAGDHDPLLARQAQGFAAQLQIRAASNQPVSELRKEAINRRLADLTDEFDRGLIKRKRFQAEVEKLLRKEGVTYKQILKDQGIAAADQFRANLQGLSKQARALGLGPKRPGSGLEPQIVSPVEAVKKAVQEKADAQADLTRTQTQAIRSTSDAALQISKDHRAVAKQSKVLLQKIHASQTTDRLVRQARAQATGDGVPADAKSP